MKTSESITKISDALLSAQKAITFASKDATNPHFRSKYADLPAVIDAVKPALNDAKICFVQTASPADPGYLALTTRLIHVSGEWIEDTAVVPLPKADPQGYGSAMTYARRYSLASMTGLYQDDDDGNAASISKPEPVMPRPVQPSPDPAQSAAIALQRPTSVERVNEPSQPQRAVNPGVARVQQVMGGRVMGDPKKPVTEGQIKRAWAMLRAKRIGDADYKEFMKTSFGKEHLDDLTMGEISSVYAWIESRP